MQGVMTQVLYQPVCGEPAIRLASQVVGQNARLLQQFLSGCNTDERRYATG